MDSGNVETSSCKTKYWTVGPLSAHALAGKY